MMNNITENIILWGIHMIHYILKSFLVRFEYEKSIAIKQTYYKNKVCCRTAFVVIELPWSLL